MYVVVPLSQAMSKQGFYTQIRVLQLQNACQLKPIFSTLKLV